MKFLPETAKVTVARELTKLHEELIQGSSTEVEAYFRAIPTIFAGIRSFGKLITLLKSSFVQLATARLSYGSPFPFLYSFQSLKLGQIMAKRLHKENILS